MLEKSENPRVPFWLNLVCLGILSLSIALMVASWVYQGENIWAIDMSLYKCNNCPLFAGDWSWKCFSRWFCEFNSGLDACVFFDEGTKASAAYITLEIFALVAAVLLLEKLLAYQLRRDYGSPTSLYSFCILMSVMHTLATLLWFGISDASFGPDCASADEQIKDGQVKMCAGTGPALAIAALVMCHLTMILFFVVFYNRPNDIIKIGVETGSVFSLSTRTWMYAVLSLQVLGGLFILLSLDVKEWVRRNSSEVKFEGGLLECTDCDYNYGDLGWDCFAGFMCDIDSNLGYCVMYEDLKDAGRIYIALAVTSLLVILLWAQGVVFIIQGREYGFASLNYFYAFAAVLFQLLAVTLWFKLSNSKFSSSCEADMSDLAQVPEVCSTTGPGLAITALIILGIAAAIYIVAFYKRGVSYIKEVSLKYSELPEIRTEQQEDGSQSPKS